MAEMISEWANRHTATHYAYFRSADRPSASEVKLVRYSSPAVIGMERETVRQWLTRRS
ncbi:hypothetical protein [Desulfosporosinus acidiphilus]|uniref:hypothetical protein n=1 Tax=Desulfosporosinus acidiphilus TaxID=885581 RepID=UPI00130510AA|nr:hypothetical protein [Desulfosporosinus acidiphilus]